MKLVNHASVIRSKNAGPFEITIDVLFEEKEKYNYFKQNNLINKELIKEIYQIEEEQIHHLVYFDNANGIKITIARKVSSGTINDRDVYGAQQASLLQEYEFNLG